MYVTAKKKPKKWIFFALTFRLYDRLPFPMLEIAKFWETLIPAQKPHFAKKSTFHQS